jgi:hypothetical protein
MLLFRVMFVKRLLRLARRGCKVNVGLHHQLPQQVLKTDYPILQSLICLVVLHTVSTDTIIVTFYHSPSDFVMPAATPSHSESPDQLPDPAAQHPHLYPQRTP